MSIVSYTPIVECRYGWGRVLRLYPDGLSVQGVFYALSELERVYPTYRRVFGMASARLELQFRHCRLIIPGIADVLLVQKIVDYITRGNAMTEAIGVEAVRDAYTPVTLKQLSRSESVSTLSAVHYFWEYDANDMPTTVGVIPAIPRASLSSPSSLQTLQSSLSANMTADVEPWPAMLYSERVRRLKRLQAERELRVYGFDVQALSQRLHGGSLPLVLAPLSLLAGETAHYSIEANLCTESATPAPQERRRVKDRGKLVLTNKRLIYLGTRRQVVLEYEKILEVSCLSGAVALDIEQVPQRQFFEMRRPLECSFYLRCLLQDVQSSQQAQEAMSQALLSLPVATPRSPAAPSHKPYQQVYPAQEDDTLKLSVSQLCPTPTAGGDSDDTQKLAKPVGKSL